MAVCVLSGTCHVTSVFYVKIYNSNNSYSEYCSRGSLHDVLGAAGKDWLPCDTKIKHIEYSNIE